VLLRPYREPASRIAWIVVITVLPGLGIAAYILFGEVNIGRRRVARLRDVTATLRALLTPGPPSFHAPSTGQYGHIFRVGHSISGLSPVGGNSGVLHTKSLTVDGKLALIGSANMDRRSFDLNYENNILLEDRQLSADLLQRQRAYLASSTAVTAQDIASWNLAHRLWNNAVAMFGPVL